MLGAEHLRADFHDTLEDPFGLLELSVVVRGHCQIGVGPERVGIGRPQLRVPRLANELLCLPILPLMEAHHSEVEYLVFRETPLWSEDPAARLQNLSLHGDGLLAACHEEGCGGKTRLEPNRVPM